MILMFDVKHFVDIWIKNVQSLVYVCTLWFDDLVYVGVKHMSLNVTHLSPRRCQMVVTISLFHFSTSEVKTQMSHTSKIDTCPLSHSLIFTIHVLCQLLLLLMHAIECQWML
jgi:hypothetical protein